MVLALTLACLGLLYVSANHYLSNNDTEQTSTNDQLTASDSNSNEALPNSLVNSISDGRKNEQKSQEIDNIANVILPAVENSVEFRTSKPLSTQKKMVVEESTPAVISADGSRYIPYHRVVHLDLKGAPPKLSYLKELLPLVREAGATAILMEYEDMFPFWGTLRNISAKNAYSQRDVQNLQKWAMQNDLIVIPLVQTFGHMEFVLKLDEFKDLREVPIYPQSICPSQDRSWTIIQEMIDQVLSLHPDAAWLHIGCDEVYQLGQCPICSQKLLTANTDPSNSNGYQDGRSLFLQHVHRVASYVKNQKNVIPIIWDDMLRTIPAHILQDSKLGEVVEPMVWVYVEDVDRFVDSLTWANYGEVFSHIWAASAYKGAFGERLYAVNVQRHVGNNLAWLEVMRRETLSTSKLSFRGLVLTGWSRYDHFAVLCELLPIAMHSLILNLVIITSGAHDYEASKRAHRLLQCNGQKSLFTPQELRRNPQQWDAHRCRFSGSGLLGLLSSYNMNRHEVETSLEHISEKDGWMSKYNVEHKYSSPWRVHESMKTVAYLPGALKTLEQQLAKSLGQFYDQFTVEEWLEQHIQPLEERVGSLMKMARDLTERIVWPRRPLSAAAGASPELSQIHSGGDNSEDPLNQMPR